MTTLSLLGGDWLLSFDDENDGGLNVVAGLRMLQYVSGPVRTTNEVYSAVADAADEFQAMGFRNPMLPTTPNAYTMENFYFIPRSSTEWLKEGAISANWSLTGSREGDGIIRKEYAVGLGTDFAAADVGKQVTESASTDTGTLLDFDVDPDGQLVAWIRPDDPSVDVFDSTTGTISVTGDGGTGTVDVTVVGSSGFTQYSAIQAIGSVPTATEVYLLQNRFKMTDSTGGFQWWTTDATVSLGIISILIRVLDMGTTNDPQVDGIAQGDVEVFARRYTSLYDNFRLNVAAGGFQALPLASAPDINNTTGYARVTTDAWDTAWTPVVGDVFQWQGTPAQKGVVTAVSGTGPNFTIDFYHVGDLGTFNDNDIIEDIAQTGDVTLSSNETATPGGPTDASTGEGGTVTVVLGATEVDHTGDATVEPYSVTVDAQGPGANGVEVGKVHERMKYITRRGADEADLFGAGTNVPGETYRGMEVVAETNSVPAFVEGDDLDIVAKTNWSARSMGNHDTRSPPHVTIMDLQTSLQSVEDNDAIRDEALNTVTVENGAGATLFFSGAGGGVETVASVKASPFGSFTGSQIFGARGIAFINPHDDDTQAYILTDDLGVLNSPPNTVSFTVENTVAGDRVLVARDTGVDGIIDKDQFGGMTAVAANSKTITVAGTVDTEVPQSGWVRVVENTILAEHRYVYDSRTTGASGVFTLRDITQSSATAGTSSIQLSDSTADFVGEGVEIGMLILDFTNTGVYEVVTVTDLNTLVIRHVEGADLFASGDGYVINETVQLYATTDDIYDLILDVEATGTSESNTFVQSTLFDVVVNVRQGKVILPFTQNAPVTASGGGVTVVRQPDTIAT